ncbi:helix-turn-helix transcriptional regulator [Bacillus alkalisoli]|uniref:helix-turn-helix transcriptional regulator n=1 Tax=Bacillus alkalisoli TaxID=2011008 RepID=UPI000C23932C|nr:helix-turn-helix domain-containing protein [Bacillus alkalisoli]
METFTFENIKSYQSFASLKEMNEVVRRFLYTYKSSLSNAAIEVVRYIAKHSCKVIGVSFSKNETIANALNISLRTVTRSISKLVELGILKKIHTFRENGKQGVNLLVIVPFFSTKVSTYHDQAGDHPNKTSKKLDSLCENKKPIYDKKGKSVNPLFSSLLDKKNLKKDPTEYIDSSYLPSFIHPEFVKVADPFFTAVEIFSLWGRVNTAYNKIHFDRPLEELIPTVVQSLKVSIFYAKKQKDS